MQRRFETDENLAVNIRDAPRAGPCYVVFESLPGNIPCHLFVDNEQGERQQNLSHFGFAILKVVKMVSVRKSMNILPFLSHTGKGTLCKSDS